MNYFNTGGGASTRDFDNGTDVSANTGGIIFIKHSKPVRHLQSHQNHSRIPRARAMRPVRNRNPNNINNNNNPHNMLSRRSRNLAAVINAQTQAAQPKAVVLRPPGFDSTQLLHVQVKVPMSPTASPPLRVPSSDQSFDSAPSQLTLSPEHIMENPHSRSRPPTQSQITLPLPISDVELDLEDAIVLIESDDESSLATPPLKRVDYLSLSDGSTIRSDSPPEQMQAQAQGQTRRAWELGGTPAWAPAKDEHEQENENTLESTARRRAELWVAMGAQNEKKQDSPGSVRQLAALWETRHSPHSSHSQSPSPPSPPAVLKTPLAPEPEAAPVSLGVRTYGVNSRAIAPSDSSMHSQGFGHGYGHGYFGHAYGYQRPRVTGYWEGDERSTPSLALRRVALQAQEQVSAPAAAWGGVGTTRRGRPLPRTVRARRATRRVRTDVVSTPNQVSQQGQTRTSSQGEEQEDVSLLHDEFVAFQTRPTRRRRAAARILSNLSSTSASATTGSDVIASVTAKSSRGWRAALRRARLLSRLAS